MFKFLLIALFPILVFAESENDQLIHRRYYSFSYNERHEVANWVYYSLELPQLEGCVDRTNNFRPDPLVLTGSSTPADYYKSGFDRGHLVPAGDMKFSLEANKDSFYMSNMTPQPPSFNRGKWSSLENLIRAWVLKYKKIWIVTGPVLRENLPSIGIENRVSVPVQYFKAIIRRTEYGYEGIGFLMRTDLPYPELINYVVNINTIERITGLDLFSYLDDSIEEKVEEFVRPDRWDFKAKFAYLPCRSF